jgi:hypothetical protein
MTDYEFGDEPDIDYETPAVMPEGSAEALDRASWHMRMASMISTERDQITAVYKAEMERLQIRLQHRIRIFDDRIAWHEEPVSSLHLALLRDEPKRKSIELPYGTSKVRVPKTPRVEFTDQPATLAWAEVNHPEILGHTINVTGVKSIAVPLGEAGSVTDTNGEIIPGVQAVLDDPSWSVSYDSEES